MAEKKVKIMKKGTFEREIEGPKSLVTKDYVDHNHGENEVMTYEEALSILDGGA